MSIEDCFQCSCGLGVPGGMRVLFFVGVPILPEITAEEFESFCCDLLTKARTRNWRDGIDQGRMRRAGPVRSGGDGIIQARNRWVPRPFLREAHNR
jgi:hypothetical protein